MYIVDDPTLALITRFVGDAQNLNLSNADFLLRQIAAIEQYVGRFPASERQARALEWIEAHAMQYRREWQKQAVVEALSQARCPDCPLAGGDRMSPCAVHHRWQHLLRRYTEEELSSHEYVEETLNLLGTCKNRLKVGQTRRQSQHAPPEFDTA
jgi:hypothetical protein